MSRLRELIDELCPDGVEYKTLKECCTVRRTPKGILRSKYGEGTKHPIVDQGQGLIAGYTDNESLILDFDGCVVFGDHTREVKWIDFPFAVGADGVKVLTGRSDVMTRYLYYAMTGLHIISRGYNRHWSIAKELFIPVPPIEVQREAVRILDSFQELDDALTAEIEAREKQFEKYRDGLLGERLQKMCPDGVEYKTLGEVSTCYDSQRKPVTRKDRIPGPYPYYGAAGVQDYVADYIFDGEYVLLAEDGSVTDSDGRPVVNYINGKVWVNNHAHILRGNKDTLTRYLYYVLPSLDIRSFISGPRAKLNQASMRAIRIPVPPIEVQREIVSKLDAFQSYIEAMVSERDARRKQFAYYRDKLLSLSEKVTVDG